MVPTCKSKKATHRTSRHDGGKRGTTNTRKVVIGTRCQKDYVGVRLSMRRIMLDAFH